VQEVLYASFHGIAELEHFKEMRTLLLWVSCETASFHKPFFFKRFIAQKISEIHRVTKLRNCSYNQFALIVPRRANDTECTVLGSYEYNNEKQVQRKNTAVVG
jgi:hypothetical protein